MPPHPSTSSQQLQWSTTCLCSCCRRYRAFLATCSPCSRVWVTSVGRTSLSVHKNDSGFLSISIFVFFLFCSTSPSTVCLFTVRKLYAHAQSRPLCFLGEFQALPGIWTTACWVIYSGSIWTQIFLKRCQGRRGKKRSLWYVWTWPGSICLVKARLHRISDWLVDLSLVWLSESCVSVRSRELYVRSLGKPDFFFKMTWPYRFPFFWPKCSEITCKGIFPKNWLAVTDKLWCLRMRHVTSWSWVTGHFKTCRLQTDKTLTETDKISMFLQGSEDSLAVRNFVLFIALPYVWQRLDDIHSFIPFS